MLLSICTQAQAPASEKTVTVKGAVKNETGEPLSGVSVVIKGTSNGVTTKEDGYFKLNAPVNSTLSISMVGYINKEIKVGKTDQLDLAISLTFRQTGNG
jgi:hypothetical protein